MATHSIVGMCLLTCLGTGPARADDSVRLDFFRPAFLGPPEEVARPAGAQPLRLLAERTEARPEDRWIQVRFQAWPLRAALPETRLAARLFALGATRPLAETIASLGGHDGRVWVDLRRHRLKQARVCLELLEDGQATAVAEVLLAAHDCPAPLPSGHRIRVSVDVAEGTQPASPWPVTFGVPFPRGALWDESRLRVVDQDGREVPAQKEVTGRWACEGAIQWVRFDALVDPGKACFVEVAPPGGGDKPSPPAPLPQAGEGSPVVVPQAGERRAGAKVPLPLNEDGGRLILDTGAARYVLAKGPSPIEEVWLGDARVAHSQAARGLYVIDQTGRLARASAEDASVAVEAAGPVAACVRFEGDYRTSDGQRLARHITRVEARAGQPCAQITHTLVLTNDTNETWFQEVGWELAVQPGADPRATFNVSRGEPAKTVGQALAAGASVWMLQDSHTRFGGGENHFAVTVGAGDRQSLLAEGEECGDWTLLSGRQAGLMIACKEAARQHPKEFLLAADRIVLKLFSGRAGEQLDFRAPVLAKKWNLAAPDAVAKLPSNAAGWSKTHEVCIAPVAAVQAESSAARLAAVHRRPVYALAEPGWIRTSEALGPLHPRDPERFPETEQVIDRLFEVMEPRGQSEGHYGFVDYFAGPTYGGNARRGIRYRYTYGLRSSIWLTYARSGQRAVREFAEGTNKAYLDNWLVHWESPSKPRGLFTQSGGLHSEHAFYWGTGSCFEISSSTNLNQFLWMYQLTGYRRGKDAVLQYAEGLKQAWTPGMHDWRVLMVLRVLTQCYATTFDPELAALAEATLDSFVDKDAEILLTKNRPYGSSTYKTGVDVRGLIEAWQVFGLPKYRQVADVVSRHWWKNVVGDFPITYMNPLGFVGNFLYQQSPDPAIAAGLEFGLRRANTHKAGTGASALAAVFESLPYAMDVVARTEPSQRGVWIAYRDYGFPASVVAWKGKEAILDLVVRSPRAGKPGELGSLVRLRPLAEDLVWGADLNRLAESSSGAVSLRVPKDAPEGAYEILPVNQGGQFVLVRQRTPIVLHAPQYWVLPDIAPPVRIWFKLPEDARDAQIFFEGAARLFDPDGRPFPSVEPVRGWIDLRADRPGLWSFEAVENRLVRGRNFPPFFAFGSADLYFDPKIPWEQEPRAAPSAERPAEDAQFVPSGTDLPDDRALHLTGQQVFALEGGPPHAGGDGLQFLPNRRGTIEFFFRPNWGTFDLSAGGKEVKRFFVRILADKSPRQLIYRIDPEGTTVNMGPREPSHSMFGNLYLANPRRSELRCWLTQTLFEPGQWVHVAWVWGPQPQFGPHHEKLSLMTMQIFVNGRGARQVIFRTGTDGVPPDGLPKEMIVGPLDGAIDELRVSDVERYSGDFPPPPRAARWRVDRHTRALFHFDGDTRGEGFESPESPAGTLRKAK